MDLRRLSIARLTYTITLSMVFALVAAGQILGFAGWYRPAPVVVLAVLLFAGAGWLYWQRSEAFFAAVLESEPQKRSGLDTLLGLAGLALILVLILLPVARWPFSPVSETLNWDAGIYHLPKVLEMVRSGSAWDLSIPYGEYPFGYESVLAFTALLTRTALGFGAAHALTCLFFILTVWLLLRRYTGLPGGVSFLLVALVMVSGFFPELKGNLWWMFQALFFTIGKNDLFLGAALLAVILHAPIGPRDNQQRVFPLGLAMTTMLALATKPNSILVAFPVWGIYLWRCVRGRSFRLQEWAASALVIAPGLLWAVRNLIAQGELFSPLVMEHQKLSIAANLFNPYLLNHVPRTLFAAIGVFLITLLLAFFNRRITPSLVLVDFLVLAGFALTPASGFYHDTQRPAEINWRFGQTVLVFLFLLPLTWVSVWLKRLYAWVQRRAAASAMLALATLFLTAGIIWLQREVLEYRPKNDIVLYDQFREAVGTGGYFSAYDYLHRNVRDSVVWVENGMPFYAYGPGWTNTTTLSRRADYLVIFQTPWLGGEPSYPAYLSDPDWMEAWTIVYEDPQGRVYRRIQE